MTVAVAEQAAAEDDVTVDVAGSAGAAAAAEDGTPVGNGEDTGGDGTGDEDEEDEEEAEEIARRLKEQLWADINKAQAAQASAKPPAAAVAARPGELAGRGPRTAAPSKKRDAALQTMKGILAITADDALAHATLASAVVPGTDNDNVLSVLSRVVRTGSVSKELARALTPVLVSLARSDTLFATMRHSNAPALQLDKGKRKRDESEEEQRQSDARALKRPGSDVAYPDFQRQITEAANVVSSALGANSSTDRSLDPSVISSIQLQLHQLFLFSMTSSAGGGPEMNALQEVGGLIQVLGVLSGIQIGPAATPGHAAPRGSALHPDHPWIPQTAGTLHDIGTAVYPCLVAGCRKIFARLYSLRAHQRVHAAHRPYRCAVCPASFARNHDLKRHAKLHEKKAWQCAGCDKTFSRRDAIKRHKNSSAARGGKGNACVHAAIKEVALDNEGDDDGGVREGRRTRTWADAAAVPYHHQYHDGQTEEGEVHADVVRRMQAAVLGLHATLQKQVSSALGTDHAAPALHLDPTGGQATLASVIARAQMQNLAGASLGLGRGEVTQGSAAADGDGHDGHDGSVYPAGSAFSHAVTGDEPRTLSGTSLDSARTTSEVGEPGSGSAPRLSLYGLSEEQTRLLEQAIANAASAAQAQAEAEAALEEEGEEEEQRQPQPGLDNDDNA